jgi:hypothetical protein
VGVIIQAMAPTEITPCFRRIQQLCGGAGGSDAGHKKGALVALLERRAVPLLEVSTVRLQILRHHLFQRVGAAVHPLPGGTGSGSIDRRLITRAVAVVQFSV